MHSFTLGPREKLLSPSTLFPHHGLHLSLVPEPGSHLGAGATAYSDALQKPPSAGPGHRAHHVALSGSGFSVVPQQGTQMRAPPPCLSDLVGGL